MIFIDCGDGNPDDYDIEFAKKLRTMLDESKDENCTNRNEVKMTDIEKHIEDIPDELVTLFVKVFGKMDGWENITIKDFLDVIEKEFR